MQDAEIRAEGFQVERRGRVERVEQALEVVDREGGDGGGERVVVDERDGFLRCELEVAEDGAGKLGHRREIGHPDRPVDPDGTVHRR